MSFLGFLIPSSHAVLLLLAQIPVTDAGKPNLTGDAPSSILKLLLGFLMVIFVLLVAFKVAPRNRSQE